MLDVEELNGKLLRQQEIHNELFAKALNEKDEIALKCEHMEKELTCLKQKLRRATDEAVKARCSAATPLKDNEESKSFKTQIQTLKQQVQKHEANEKRFKNMMVEKESEFEQERIEMKRMLNAERKRFKDLQESSQLLRASYEQLQDDIFHQVKEKDRKLSLLNSTVKDL